MSSHCKLEIQGLELTVVPASQADRKSASPLLSQSLCLVSVRFFFVDSIEPPRCSIWALAGSSLTASVLQAALVDMGSAELSQSARLHRLLQAKLQMLHPDVSAATDGQPGPPGRAGSEADDDDDGLKVTRCLSVCIAYSHAHTPRVLHSVYRTAHLCLFQNWMCHPAVPRTPC